jgi:hypothetical protein
MIERCPCCHAQLKLAPVCRRCQTDLKHLFHCEKSSQYYMSQAVQYLLDNEIEKSCMAINHSLYLKRTEVGLMFRDFLIHQQSQLVLDLLAQSELLLAKNTLYCVRQLIPYSQTLQQLDCFSNYLLLEK